VYPVVGGSSFGGDFSGEVSGVVYFICGGSSAWWYSVRWFVISLC
jgi:hypothetical protein